MYGNLRLLVALAVLSVRLNVFFDKPAKLTGRGSHFLRTLYPFGQVHLFLIERFAHNAFFQETHYENSIQRIVITYRTPSVLARAASAVGSKRPYAKTILSRARPVPARLYLVEGKIPRRVESAIQSG